MSSSSSSLLPAAPTAEETEQIADTPDAPTSAEPEIIDRVTLVSAEEDEFIMPRRLALISSTIEAMLAGPREGDTVVHLPCIPTHILQVVCDYMAHKDKCERLQKEKPDEPVGNFYIPEQPLTEVMLAAHFLDC